MPFTDNSAENRLTRINLVASFQIIHIFEYEEEKVSLTLLAQCLITTKVILVVIEHCASNVRLSLPNIEAPSIAL